MAALGSFSDAILITSKVSVGARPPKQESVIFNRPNIGIFSPAGIPQRKITGSVFEKNIPVSRTILILAEEFLLNGQPSFIARTVSDSTTGIYTANLGSYSGRVSVVCFDGNLSSTLAVAINSTTTTIILSSAPINNINNQQIIIDSEVMMVTGGGGTTILTVTRGFNETLADVHLIDAPVSKLSLNSKIFSKVTAEY